MSALAESFLHLAAFFASLGLAFAAFLALVTLGRWVLERLAIWWVTR